MDSLTHARRTFWFSILWLLAFGAMTRYSVLGDPVYFNDETFYWIAGLRMHDGLLPYVDVWDRKGPGLFLTYWLITGISRQIAAFQIAGWLCASASAVVLWRVARGMMGQAGALLAGTLYLAAMPMFGGAGGQSPVFYNLAMVTAVWLALRGRVGALAGRMNGALIAAMASAGFALTFKQSALPEALFLGLAALVWLWRGGLRGAAWAGRGVLLAAAGAAPFAAFALAYAVAGHFAAFYQAMVGANIAKPYDVTGDHWGRTWALASSASPGLVLAGVGAVLAGRRHRGFALGWLVAAMVGVCLPPNFYHHYMLPLLLPMALLAGFAMDKRPWGMVAGAVAMWIFAMAGPAFEFDRREAGRVAMARVVAMIRARDPAPRLLVYEGPVALYGMLGSYPPSPLLDNFHLHFPPEDNASQFDTAAEMRRDLAWKPTVVVIYHDMPAGEENPRTGPLVHGYLKGCRQWDTVTYPQAVLDATIEVWGDCGRPAP